MSELELNAGQIERSQDEYYKKIGNNTTSGLQKLSRANFTPFEGWKRGERSDRIFDILLEIDDESQRVIANRVVTPLKKIAERCGVHAYFVDEDWLPAHVKVEAGVFENATEDEMIEVGNCLRDSTVLQQISDELMQQTYTMDRLVVGPGTYICASRFDTNQQGLCLARHNINDIRQRSARLLQNPESSFGPVYAKQDDICHLTVMTMGKGTGMSQDELIEFALEAQEKVGLDLNKNPLSIKADSVYRGRAIDYYNRHAPNLVID